MINIKSDKYHTSQNKFYCIVQIISNADSVIEAQILPDKGSPTPHQASSAQNRPPLQEIVHDFKIMRMNTATNAHGSH